MTEKKLINTLRVPDSNGILKTYYQYEYNVGNNTVYEWRKFGKLSGPNDLPALIYPFVSYWYCDGNLHRDNKPAVIYADGHTEWYQNGQRHRADDPAIEFANGGKEWWIRGFRHRNDGPAVIHGHIKEYWWKGKSYSFEKWAKLATLNKEEIIEITLQYR